MAAPQVEHIPVLLDEVIELLAPRAGQAFIDCTVNGGGHSAAILERTAPDGPLLALDADPGAVARAEARLAQYGERVHVVQSNFRAVSTVARTQEFDGVAGILMDLGFSSNQLEGSGRGFSFGRDEPLDMRFDPSSGRSVADFLSSADREDIARVLWELGEETHSRRIADAIVERRAREPMTRTQQLADLVARTIGGHKGRIHPATRTFQALRIFVNDELGALREALPQALSVLRRGGRLAVISFHSLEDRIVKTFLRREAGLDPDPIPRGIPFTSPRAPAQVQILTRRPITPAAAEVARNPRSRSARLRVAERV
jgi:16S rRNA (cytosine1402-N4)-methyltransferase